MKCTAKAFTCGQTDASTKESSKTIKNMATEPILTLMAGATKDIGRMASSMVRVPSQLLRESKGKVSGKMVSALSGQKYQIWSPAASTLRNFQKTQNAPALSEGLKTKCSALWLRLTK